jgi:hypothetical protein
MAGVPQRVLDEFSKRTEQVEQKAKELGITDYTSSAARAGE